VRRAQTPQRRLIGLARQDSLAWLGSIVIALITYLPAQTHAVTALIYQPHRADMLLPEQRWPEVFKQVRQQGFDTVVFQWTRHGQTFANNTEQQWLQRRLLDASATGLDLVVGLYADPNPRAVDQLANPQVLAYARHNLAVSQTLAAHWQSVLPAQHLVGWYLPFEIDDKRWRDRQAQMALIAWTRRDVDLLSEQFGLPVYQSAFFTGNATPTRFASLLTTLTADTGVRLWVQDGRGTLSLTTAEAARYLKNLTTCPTPAVDGVIYELFKQTSPNERFTASALSIEQQQAALQQAAPCDGDSVFFSLRYLIDLGPLTD